MSLLYNVSLSLKVTKKGKLGIDDSAQLMVYISRDVIIFMSKGILFPFLTRFQS